MQTILRMSLATALCFIPAQAFAQKAEAGKSASDMTCPMKMQVAGMQREMGSMMAGMNAMMADMHDPKMKDRMQRMHAQMSAMMTGMQGMGGGMMGFQTAPAGKTKEAAPSKASPAVPEDHHPGQ